MWERGGASKKLSNTSPLRHSGTQVCAVAGLGNVMLDQDDLRTRWTGVPTGKVGTTLGA